MHYREMSEQEDLAVLKIETLKRIQLLRAKLDNAFYTLAKSRQEVIYLNNATTTTARVRLTTTECSQAADSVTKALRAEMRFYDRLCRHK